MFAVNFYDVFIHIGVVWHCIPIQDSERSKIKNHTLQGGPC